MGRNQKYSKIGEKLLGRLSALLFCRLTIRDHESTNQKPAFVFAVGIAGLGSWKKGLHRLIDSLDHCKFSFFESGNFEFSCLFIFFGMIAILIKRTETIT